MIDIVEQIEAIHREVATGQLPAGEGRMVRLSRTYHAPIDDVWDAVTSAGTDLALVPADQRRAPRRRPISAGGQRRRRGAHLRAATPVRRDVGLRRGHRPRGDLPGRGTPHVGRRGVYDTRARAHRHRAGGRLGDVRAGRRRGRLGRRPARVVTPLAGRNPSATPWPGRCPRRDASSSPKAARRGAPRTPHPARTRRPSRRP